jgi:hypothetical protein
VIRALRVGIAVLLISCVPLAPCLAQSGDESRPGTLEPTYEPRPVPEPAIYTTEYLFALTRGVSNSTLHPAAKAPMFLFTVPLDIVFLPVTAIAGFFPPND